MPHVEVNGGSLFYEEHGSGPALVMLAGLGYWRWCWFKQVAPLSRWFRVVAVDNRGVGDSGQPDRPYGVIDMAADVAALLDELGLGRTHVLGHSMGGFIAQELALGWPDRVDGLVLVSTSAGGTDHVPADPAIMALLSPLPDLTHEQNMRRAITAVTGPGYWDEHPDEWEQVVRVRMTRPTPLPSYGLQLQAARGWPGAGPRLDQATAPALVIHGDADQLAPPANGRRLAARIPGAQLRLLPDTGHLPFIERAPMFNRLVEEFLLAL